MKKILFLLLLSPVFSLAQCPQYINRPVNSTLAFMGLMEQLLNMKFTDSSIVPDRSKRIYNDKDGKFIVKLSTINDAVQNIYFEAPSEAMSNFTTWFEKEFAECETSRTDGTILYKDCVVLTRATTNKKQVFYMEAKKTQ